MEPKRLRTSDLDHANCYDLIYMNAILRELKSNLRHHFFYRIESLGIRTRKSISPIFVDIVQKEKKYSKILLEIKTKWSFLFISRARP